jgi:SPP1 family predicted phage head-tail adaptor
MPNCARIKPKPYKVCTGDMRAYITIKRKTKASQNTGAANPNLNLTTIFSTWAAEENGRGEEIFDGVNMVGKVSHKFIYRFDPDHPINKTDLVEYDGNRFEIIDVVPNYQGRRYFTALKCTIRGLDTLENTKL